MGKYPFFNSTTPACFSKKQNCSFCLFHKTGTKELIISGYFAKVNFFQPKWKLVKKERDRERGRGKSSSSSGTREPPLSSAFARTGFTCGQGRDREGEGGYGTPGGCLTAGHGVSLRLWSFMGELRQLPNWLSRLPSRKPTAPSITD